MEPGLHLMARAQGAARRASPGIRQAPAAAASHPWLVDQEGDRPFGMLPREARRRIKAAAIGSNDFGVLPNRNDRAKPGQLTAPAGRAAGVAFEASAVADQGEVTAFFAAVALVTLDPGSADALKAELVRVLLSRRC